MIGRLGFACKYLHLDQSQKKKVLEELQRFLTEKCTTITWLNRQTREEAEQRPWDIMEHNGAAALRLVQYVGSLSDALRMVLVNQSVYISLIELFLASLMSTKEQNNFITVGEAHASLMYACLCIPGSLLFCK